MPTSPFTSEGRMKIRLWWKRFKCNVLDWHRAPILSFDGCSNVGRCYDCRRKVLMDSNGDWFAIEREAPDA